MLPKMPFDKKVHTVELSKFEYLLLDTHELVS